MRNVGLEPLSVAEEELVDIKRAMIVYGVHVICLEEVAVLLAQMMDPMLKIVALELEVVRIYLMVHVYGGAGVIPAVLQPAVVGIPVAIMVLEQRGAVIHANNVMGAEIVSAVIL
jgi:hypothetical protein